MRKAVFVFCLPAFVLILLPEAFGNPIWSEMSFGMQVPDTMNVQVSFVYDKEWSPEVLPVGVENNGYFYPFVEGIASFEENTGSGPADVAALQVCHCNLSPGEYQYTFSYSEADEGDNWDEASPVTVTVVSPPPEPQDPEPVAEGEEIWPWEIPTDPWPKGLDCTAWCLEHGDGRDGPVEVSGDLGSKPDVADGVPGWDCLANELMAGDGAVAGGDVTGEPPAKKKDGKTCAFGSTPASGAAPVLLLVVLFAFVLARRRRFPA